MGISFGSNSMKPYAGGKEVQEAYVGSQLVYQATVPIVYKFLGAENTYTIDGTLGNGAAIVKKDGVYRISLGGNPGEFVFDSIPGYILRFTIKGDYAASRVCYIQGSTNGTTWEGQNYIAFDGSGYVLKTFTPPSNWVKIKITKTSAAYNVYLDAVRLEIE